MDGARPYEAFSRDYDALQGELAEACWDSGIIRELGRYRRTSGRVFDAGAGTGVGARKLKSLGTFEVTSCDQSWSMLSTAEPFSDKVLHANLADLPMLEKRFDLVLSGFDALNYLKPDALASFFGWCKTHLTQGGLLVFDYSSPTLLREEWRSREYVDHRDSLALRRTHRYDANYGRAVIDLACFDRGQERWRETHYQYSVSCEEMVRLAHESAMGLLSVRDLGDDGYSADAHTHVYAIAIGAS